MSQLPLKIFRQIMFSSGYNGTPCWVWTGARHKLGYGRTRFKGDVILVHRLVYELLVGPIPEGLELDHLCRNQSCCNPNHLEPVTHAENCRRARLFLVKKTHCPAGHEYTPENTYTNPSTGYSYCRTCKNKSQSNAD